MNPDPHAETLRGVRSNASGAADDIRGDEGRDASATARTESATQDPRGASMPGTIDVRLTSIRFAAEGINLYELRRVDERPLPPATPGAHIDVHLPNGMIRQYSLAIIDPASSCYVIGVKCDPNGRGGSRYMHDESRVGTTLKIGEPRNNFPVSASARHSVFIAGGMFGKQGWNIGAGFVRAYRLNDLRLIATVSVPRCSPQCVIKVAARTCLQLSRHAFREDPPQGTSCRPVGGRHRLLVRIGSEYALRGNPRLVFE
jgi:hypothetical protein